MNWHSYSVFLLLLASIFTSGCIDQNSNLPQPHTLSDARKESFSRVDPDVYSKNPDAFMDSYIFLQGDVSWISYEGGKTVLIINLKTYSREPVLVHYGGRLQEDYRETAVAVYGIAKGRETIKNTRTGEDMVVPKIAAIQIIPAWIDEPVTSNESTFKLVAESKSLSLGERFEIGSGYALRVNSLDGKANPKQVWISLERGGIRLDDKVMIEGEIYTFRNTVSFMISSISDGKLVLSNVRIAKS